MPTVVFNLVCNKLNAEDEFLVLTDTFFDKKKIRKRVCSATEIALARGTFAT
jgi:hypothetical protein